MENFEIIDDNIVMHLDTSIFELTAIKKAMFNLSESIECLIETENEKGIKLVIHSNKESNDIELAKKIYKEIMLESVRYEVSNQTKNLRELITARALYSTCIDLDNGSCDQEVDSSNKIDNIAINWFEKYGEDNKC
jgi:His-Xaa-Ser system protein HxsD